MNIQTSNNLAEILRTFNESTVRLQRAYEALQVRFGELDRELEDKNRELSRKVAEINEIKEYLNSILQSVTDGVIAVNLTGEITAFNSAAERITGLDGKDIIGSSYEDVFETGFGFDVNEAMDESRRRASYVTGDMKVKGRVAFPIRESTSPTRDARGKITGAVKVFEDLTELRELEEQARRQDRLAALGQMAATVAHEIRNPLGGIEGFASLLSRDFDEDDPRSRLVRKILEGARSLNRVVNELLVFTRPMKLDFHKVELTRVVDGAISFLTEDIKRPGIRLYKRFGSKQLTVWGDDEQLQRAILNIIINAIQAMPHGGTLSISCRCRSLPRAVRQMLDINKNGTWVEVVVKDSGPGIDESDLPFIFNPFYTKKEKGTGLGLAVAVKIVEAHKGQITASNVPEGGAMFVISLPLENE